VHNRHELAWITEIEIGEVSLIGLIRSLIQLVTESEEPESSIKDPVVELSGTDAVGIGSLLIVVAVIE
jgi:hypothetical protein